METIEKCGGRKFIFAVLAFFTLVGMRGIGWIDITAFSFLAGSIIAGYLTANVAQKALAKETT